MAKRNSTRNTPWFQLIEGIGKLPKPDEWDGLPEDAYDDGLEQATSALMHLPGKRPFATLQTFLGISRIEQTALEIAHWALNRPGGAGYDDAHAERDAQVTALLQAASNSRERAMVFWAGDCLSAI
jgi:hypothetical protein